MARPIESNAEKKAEARRILLIIPAYNEAASLPSLVTALKSLYPYADVLVVDDGSTDNTASIAKELPVRLVSLPCNLGVGGAVQTGLLIALRDNYDVAVQVDGDGQQAPVSKRKTPVVWMRTWSAVLEPRNKRSS